MLLHFHEKAYDKAYERVVVISIMFVYLDSIPRYPKMLFIIYIITYTFI